MDVLNRRMFQVGGTVDATGVRTLKRKPIIQGYRDPKTVGYETLEYENGKYYQRARDEQGNLMKDVEVNLALSPTRDPVDAYQKQQMNDAVSFGVSIVPGGLATRFGVGIGAKFLGPSILAGAKGLGNLFAKAASKVSPVTASLKPGRAVPGMKGFQPQNPYNPFSYQNPRVNPTGALITGGTTAVTQVPKLYAQETELDTTDPNFLTAQLAIINNPDASDMEKQAARDLIQAAISPTDTIQEGLNDLGTSTPSPTPTPAPEEVIEEEPEEQVQEEPQGQEKAQRTANSLSNFFSSDAFNSALRNIGSSLVREGRFGAGLASGAAGFAEEQEAKRLLEEERMAKLFEAQAKGGMSFSDQLSLDKAVNEKQLALAGNVRDFNNAQAAYELAQSVIDLANGNTNLASFGSKIGATVDNILAGAGLKDLSEYENLTDTEKARIALNELTNRNIKEILGESGRTISNIDRDIAKRVVGTLDLQDIKSVASLKKTLQNNIEMITEKGNEAQRQIAANSGFLLKYIPTLFKNDPELLEILKKDFGAPSDNITTQDIGNLKPRVVKTTLRG